MIPSKLLVLLLLILFTSTGLAQGNKTGFPPEQRMQTRQGFAGERDVIAHKAIAKGTHLQCLQVEHHSNQDNDHAACQLKFQDGTTHTLEFDQITQAPCDGEVYLECLGGKPRKCVVGLY